MMTMTESRVTTNGLTAYFQPILDLEKWQVSGVEALARHEDGSSAFPFLAQAKREGRYVEVEIPLLDIAMKEARGLPTALFCTLNISAQGVLDPRLKKLVEGRPERTWGLEILEDSARLNEYDQFMARIAELGCMLLIDDAGEGNSDELRIRYLRPTIVKLDRLLLMRAMNVPAERARLESLIVEGRAHGAKLLAEGVETAEQLDFARELGCEYAQGYYFSEAVSAQRIPQVIAELEQRLWIDAN